MGKIIGGWLKVSFYDPADGTTVQLNHISTEFSEFNHPNIMNETTTGNIFGGRDIEMIVGMLESDGIGQLRTWKENGTPVQAVAKGQQEDVVFHVSEEIDFERGVGIDARNGVSVHRAQLVTIGENPLAKPLQNLASDSDLFSGDDDLFAYPIQGVTIQAAADYASVATPVDLVIEALDYGTDGTDGSVLASTTLSVTGDGRFSDQLTLPASTYAVRVNFVSNTGSATVTNHTIRTDGNTEYVNY